MTDNVALQEARAKLAEIERQRQEAVIAMNKKPADERATGEVRVEG